MNTPSQAKKAALRAIEVGGGPATLAESLGIRYQAVQRWKLQQRIPVARVLAVEQVTGVSRHDLRPDIYPREKI